MTFEDKICQAYIEELQQLEKFRLTHSELYQDTPLETEDPYTKRLIEALAFFGAKARVAGERRVTEIHQRLFRQYFPYLVNDLPTFGMVQFKPSIRFPEKVVLNAGTELFFKAEDEFKAVFQTLDPVAVFPVFLKKFQFDRQQTGGWRCLMQFSTLHISTEEIGSFKLYVNHLNNFFSSLKVGFSMVRCLKKAQVFYDERLEEKEGLECSMKFGLDASQRQVFYHEIEQLRSLFHLPQQELFMTFDIPPCGKRWQSFTLCLDFDESWPEFTFLNGDSLIPFVVPIVNLKNSAAEPLMCDGTKEAYPLLHPDPLYRFELHTLLGVYEVQPGSKKLIKPGILGDGSESFEIDYFKKELLIDLPQTFADPKIVYTEALWFQPSFSDYVHRELSLYCQEASAYGLEMRLLDSLYRGEKTIEEDPHFLIRILSLKNQNSLNLNEILFILKAMNKLEMGVFGTVVETIRDLKVSQKRDAKGYQFIMEYAFYLKDLGDQKWELVVLFFKYLHRLLNAWLPNIEIETQVYFSEAKKPLIIKQGDDYELSALARNFFLSG